MKKYILFLILPFVVTISSCNDWLDVKPQTTSDVEEMFKADQGFKDALIACYIKLADRSLYGEQMTMTVTEYLAQHWNLNTSNYKDQIKLKDYDFDTDYAINTLSSIYGGLYNVIAQSNIILTNINETGDVIKKTSTRAIIEAEALTIRAFCHFDIMRLFGQIPNSSSKTVNLTYATQVTQNPLEVYSYKDYMSLIEKDLTKAEKLFKEYDPIMKYSYYETDSPSKIELEDNFLSNRRFRFNYYALQALKARIMRYEGKDNEAYRLAKELIDATNEQGNKVIDLAGDADFKSKNYNLPSETLFALSCYKLPEYIGSLMNVNDLRESTNRLKEIFIGQSEAINNRYIQLWVTTNKDSQGNIRPVLRKYEQPEKNSSINNTIIPLIRMSEIYLIAIESASTIDEKNALYHTYMKARNVVTETTLDENEIAVELEREYRREFYGEGQMFFFYKRNLVTKQLWKTDREITADDYILPLPLTELIK